jgi:predicted chitinase
MTQPIDFTEAQLRQFSPKMQAGYRDALLAGKDKLRQHGILDNGKRLSHFMGQYGGETEGGTVGRESLTYTTVAAVRGAWRARAAKHTDAWIKANLLRNPVALGDWAYGGRMGNVKGTTDGYDYRGGGFLQTTGRAAVEEYCRKCGIPIRPDILDDYAATLQFACAEWVGSGCNELADANDILGISKAINTGSATSSVIPNGMANRERWFARARDIWWDAEPGPVVAIAAPPPAAEPTGSRKIAVANAGQIAGGGIGLTLFGITTADAIGYGGGILNLVKTYGVEAVIILAFLAAIGFAAIKYFTRQDYKDGRYVPSGDAK